MSTAAIVLAAGPSTRVGRPKQLLEWGGRPLLEHVVATVAEWPVDETIVVLGAYEDEILDEVDFGEATVAINPDWEEGVASSIRVGLDIATRGRFERAFIVLADQPEIPEAVPDMLLRAMDDERLPAAVPKYRYQRGAPVLVDRSLWARLMSTEGDADVVRWLDAHPEWTTEVRIDVLPPRDVDTQDDAADIEDTHRG